MCFVAIFPYLALCSIDKQYNLQLLLCLKQDSVAAQKGGKLDITGHIPW